MSVELRPLAMSDLPAARSLLADACRFDDAARVADEKLFGAAPSGATGAAFGAFRAGALAGLSVASGRWIRLLAVAPAMRGRGIGTALLAAAESATTGAPIRTMDQPGNYLAPGVSVDNVEAITWLERRGYRRRDENSNLVIDLAGNPRVSESNRRELVQRAALHGYQIRRARLQDAAALVETVEEEFGRAWAFEVARALDRDTPGVHVAVHGTAAVAFAAHDGNNRGLGWFGPAGTLPAHRGKKLGEALLIACLLDLAGEGRRECTVAWIGPRDFYQRAAGVAREERFVVLEKELDR